MPQQPFSFRDFGLLPENLQPPPEKIRSFFSAGRVIGQYIGTGLVSALGLGLTVLFALTMPLPLNLLAGAAALAGFGALVYLATHNDYRWVELEGDTLRAKHLYTGRTIERSVGDIESLGTMVYQVRKAATVVMEKLLGRVKGIEIRFRDRRTPLRILRADPAMTNAQELIEGLLYRMSQIHELDAEIVQFAGRPLVRHIYWKGEKPSAPPGKNLKVFLCCLMLLALLFGTIGGYWGFQEQMLQRLASVPPQEIALAALIQNGPGANRHVTVTDFLPGGRAIEDESGSTTNWVALFPSGVQPNQRKDIQVVLRAKGEEADVVRRLKTGSVTGICSERPSVSWGAELGPILVKANPGCQLTSAWEIEELRERPSAALVTGLLTGSAACFAAVIVFALLLFWLAA